MRRLMVIGRSMRAAGHRLNVVSRHALLALLVVSCGCGNPAATKAEAVAEGDRFTKEGKHGDAIQAYRRAVSADPSDGAVRLKLANAYWSGEQWMNGSTEAVRAADLLPGDASVQVFAAEHLLYMGRFVDAADRVDKVLAKQPRYAAALVVLGNARAELLDSQWALQKLRSVARNVRAYEAARPDARPPRGSPNDAEAERAFRAALRIAPDEWEPRVALANFLWAAGRQDEAEPILRELADGSPDDLILNHALGGYYLSRGRAEEGERYFRNAAATGDREVRLQLVDHYIGAGRDDDALAILTAINGDEPPGSVSLPAAGIELRRGQHQAALRHVDGLLARAPRHLGGLLLKAQILQAMSNPGGALESARAAVAADPQSADARFALGRLLAARGDSGQATEAFQEGVRLAPLDTAGRRELARAALTAGRNEVALQHAQAIVRADPTDHDLSVVLATALVRLGDHAVAEREIPPMLARFPASAPLLVQWAAVQAVRGGSGARATFERALKLSPDSFDALSGLVSIDLSEGRLAAARSRIGQAVAAHPGESRYLLLLGRVQAAGDDVAAESTFRRVLSSDPSSAEAAQQLAALLVRRKKTAEAEQVLRQLLQRDAGAGATRHALAMLLESQGRVAEAQREYQKILADDPRAALSASRLAVLYSDLGGDSNLNAALQLAVDAKQQLRDHPDVNDALGWVHVRKGIASVGIPYLESSVRSAPDNAGYRYHLGAAYLEAGRIQKGREEMTKALELEPTFRHAREARAALAASTR
jgi:tetratricopeptide (TPR) repeat protein